MLQFRKAYKVYTRGLYVLWFEVVLFCINCTIVVANPIITHYNERSGMVNTKVYGISTLNNHHLWISTDNGLVRFTGKKWINYNFNHLAGNNFVVGVSRMGKSGPLIVSVYRNSLYEVLPQGIRKVKIDEIFPLGSSDINKRTWVKLFSCWENELWAWNNETASIYKLEWTGKKFIAKSYKFSEETVGNFISFPNSNEILYAIGDRILKYSREDDQWSLYYKHRTHIKSVVSIGKDSLVISDVKGLALISAGNYKRILSTSVGHQLFYSRYLRGFVYNDSLGSLILTPIQQPHKSLELKENFQANCFFEDSIGHLWIGSYGQGVLKISASLFQDRILGLPINDLATDERNQVFATHQNGFYKVNALSLQNYILPPSKVNNFLVSSVASTVLVHIDNRIFNAQGKLLSTLEKRQSIYCINKAKNGDLVAGCYSALYRLDAKSFKVLNKHSLPPGLKIHHVVGKGDSLLLASSMGVLEIDNGIQRFLFTQFAPLKNAYVRSLNVQDSALWITTPTAVYKYHHGSIESMIPPSFHNTFTINHAVPDSRGALWVATDNGLWNFFKGQWAVFKEEEGLANNRVTKLVLIEDTLWVATYQGLQYATLSDLYEFLEKPYIKYPNAVGRIIPEVANNIYNYGQSNIGISIEQTNFYENGQTHMEYSIDNGKNWNDVIGNSLPLANLRDGDYHLRLRYKLRHRYATMYSPTLPFTIRPPMYRTWWAYTLYFMLALGALSFFYYRRMQKVHTKNALDKLMLQNELKLLRAQLNPHFLHNSFSILAAKISTAQPEGVQNRAYLAKLSAYFRKILELTKLETHNLEDELDFTEQYLQLQQSMYQGIFRYKITVEEDLDTISVEVPTMLLQPLVENCLKYGFVHYEKEGNIDITVITENEMPVIYIKDNGVGFGKTNEKSNLSTGLGIANAEKRILLSRNMNTNHKLITTHSPPEGGAVLRIEIPI